MQTEQPSKDKTAEERQISLKNLDALPWWDKLTHLLVAGQPYDYRKAHDSSPAFPANLVPDAETAAYRLLDTARHIMLLWGHNNHNTRSTQAVREWRDILTHPEVYRRFFGYWIGQTYISREKAEAKAEKASHQSRMGAEKEIGRAHV